LQTCKINAHNQVFLATENRKCYTKTQNRSNITGINKTAKFHVLQQILKQNLQTHNVWLSTAAFLNARIADTNHHSTTIIMFE